VGPSLARSECLGWAFSRTKWPRGRINFQALISDAIHSSLKYGRY
jgi:hypothetical protein